jgi:uncharacterized protein DUF4383
MSGQRAPVASDSAILPGHRRVHLAAGCDFLAPTSLGWVAGLLPREEGRAWWAEVVSCLAETADPAERRRYLRSYRRSAPLLVWTSWTSPARPARPALAGIDNRAGSNELDMSMLSPEDKFGIRIQSSKAPRTAEQGFSLIAGSTFILVGIIGFFITGFSNITEVTNHALFGIFMVNPFHNIVHIALGGLWLLAAFALTPAGTEGMNIAIGGIYLLTSALGWLGLFSLLSIPSGASGDNVLHLITALATFAFGCGLFRAASGQPATA